MLVQLDGRLDARSNLPVKETLHQLLERNHHKLIVDLENVPFIDSSGMVALVSGLRLANERKAQLVLSGAQSQAQEVFRLTMLDSVFSIHPSVQAARQSLT